MIFPHTARFATLLIARNPHGIWRRDPESNRAKRICNRSRKPCAACGAARMLEALAAHPVRHVLFPRSVGQKIPTHEGTP